MEKKVSDIVQAFQNYRFQDSLRQIDQLMKKVSKQDGKKKNAATISDKQQKVIISVKAGSLAATGHIHEANYQIKEYFNQKNVQTLEQDQIFLFFSISQLCNDDRLQKYVQNQVKKINNFPIKIQRFMLTFRMFSSISKLYLKQFVTSKRNQDGFAQIYLEYLAEVNKHKQIQKHYKFNLIIKPNKELNLKMVQLFFMKFLNSLKIQQVKNQKLVHSINDLRLRLSIHSQKAQQAMQIYQKLAQNLNDPFVYLRSIRQIYQNSKQVQQKKIWQCYKFYLISVGKIFKKNTSIQKYTPLYDFYDQFLQFILQKTTSTQKLEKILQNHDIKKQDLYNFQNIQQNNFEECLIIYYESLWVQLHNLINVQSLFKKSDYYKIAIKGLLLQSIKIHFIIFSKTSFQSLSQNKEFKYLLKYYFDQFSKTLTYPQQMLNYLQFIQEFTKQISFEELPKKFQKKDDNLILLINMCKIKEILDHNRNNKENEHLNLKTILQKVQFYWTIYNKYINQVQNKTKLQKGQRYLSDQFILLIADILIKFIQEKHEGKQNLSQEFIEVLFKKSMIILSQTTEISPYNSDLKLRLIHICSRLNYFDKLMDTYLSMDIKSVQFQTLGYYMIHPIRYFNVFNQFQNILTKMVRSYQQNQRQTSQYAIKALKAGASSQLFQFFSYQKRLDKSFTRIQLYYTLYYRYKNQPTSEYYLHLINKILSQNQTNKQKLSFNCDIVTMRNILFRNDKSSFDGIFNQFFGIMTSQKILSYDINLRLQQNQLKKYMQNFTNKQFVYKSNVQLLQIKLKEITQQKNINQLFYLNQFDLLQNFLGTNQKIKNCKQSNTHLLQEEILKVQVKIFVQTNLVKICALRLCQNLLNLFLVDEKQIQKKIQQVKQKRTIFYDKVKKLQQIFEQLSWRLQIKLIYQLRQNLRQIYHLFLHFSQQISKHKKISKVIKNLVNQTSQELNQLLFRFLTQMKFTKKIQILEFAKLKEILPEINCSQLQKRDQILQRLNKIDIKQAKKLLMK